GRELERPALRPLAPYLWTAWRRGGRPALHTAAPPARFAWNRLTPGELGLELTTLLALAAVGTFAFAMLAIELDAGELLPFDRASLDVADRLHTGVGEAAAAGIASLGSLRATAVAVGATILWAVSRRRAADAAALATASLATVLIAGISAEWVERPHPPASLVAVEGFGFPSGHAARAVAWVACAVVLVRGGHRLATRFAAVAAAAALAIAVAVARVYLRAEYLSDALGGLAVGTAVFALTGTLALVVTFVRQNATPT
ncbi:MAG TPA: phosphatase PAP2 family protein, partial [Solirubrobacteraceae bacterium]|nr:phosphatase PAP2 family protein [Solirubrobacteraceae bacterium]